MMRYYLIIILLANLLCDTNFFQNIYINAQDLVDTTYKGQKTGWYYISENATGLKRQLVVAKLSNFM